MNQWQGKSKTWNVRKSSLERLTEYRELTRHGGDIAVIGMICLPSITHSEFSANSDLFLSRKLKTQWKAMIMFKFVRVLHCLTQKIILDIVRKDTTNEQTRKTSEWKLTDTDNSTVVPEGRRWRVVKGTEDLICGDFEWWAHHAYADSAS